MVLACATGRFFLLLIVAGGGWFLLEWMRGRQDVIMDFAYYQIRLFRTPDAGHGAVLYHFLVLLLGCFPRFDIPAIR
ncbi:MAG: hypothetical protein R2795_26385 [Saprospiraceae bacterium]